MDENRYTHMSYKELIRLEISHRVAHTQCSDSCAVLQEILEAQR